MINQETTDDQFRITRVWAKNFRSIRELDLELGPLTVLVGPNASGKSNVMDVLRFIRDCTVLGIDRAVSERAGIEEIRRWSDGGRVPDVEVGIEACLKSLRLNYSFTIASNRSGTYKIKRDSLKLHYGSTSKSEEWVISNGKVVKPKNESASGAFDSSQLLLSGTFPIAVLLDAFGLGGDHQELTKSDTEDPFTLVKRISAMRFYVLPPSEFQRPQLPGNPNMLDEYGRNFASVVKSLKATKSRDVEEIKAGINNIVPAIVDFQVKSVGGYLAVKLNHKMTDSNGRTSGSWFNMTQESNGTLRLFGILVALYQHPSPSFIGIEEPELTIHPGAMGVLSDVIQEASLRSQIMVTTHSPDLLDRLPIDSIRAVEFVDGETRVGKVSERQAGAVKELLFTPGELHSMEGLEIETPVAQ